MNKVRWGLLSTANINRRLIPAIHESERGELVAVASRSQESADAYAQKWEIPNTFASYEAMLQSDAVDAVYISLPNHLHAKWSIYAMQHGKHVLCEKPFAISVAEVDEMMATSQSTGMRLAEAFMYRHHPQTKIVGEWVRNGRLGEITLMRGVFNFKMWTTENVRLVPEYGGGSMWDVGVYPMSMAQFIMGEPPESVRAEQWIGASGVDELFTGQLNFSNGRMAQISSGFRTPYYTHVDILGTEGRLVMNRAFTAVDTPVRELLFYPAQGDEPEEVAVPEKSLYLGEVEDMNAAILDGTPNYLTLEETRNHVRTTLALYEAARNGRLVHLSEF